MSIDSNPHNPTLEATTRKQKTRRNISYDQLTFKRYLDNRPDHVL